MSVIASAFLALSSSTVGFAGDEVEARLEIGEASGEPGEIIEVPVFFSSPYPLCTFTVLFEPDPLHVELLDYEIEGSAVAGADPESLLAETLHEGAMFGVLFGCSPPGNHLAPPGERLPLGRLRFRIGAGVPAGEVELEPVQKLFGTNALTQFQVEINGSVETLEALSDVALVRGRVMVLPPSGPRPVADVACEQFLDRVEIDFRVISPYESIEVHRDGDLVATLPGDATSFAEPVPRLGPLAYTILGWREGKSSIPVSCELLAVSPAAPPPEDLRCAEGTLTWQNGATYDRIRVLRNGTEIAELSGDARCFTDESVPEGPTVYSIIGELEGFTSPEATCVAGGVWAMEAGDVLVPLDAERVEVPIFVTTAEPVEAVQILLGVDLDRLELVRDEEAALAGTVGPRPEFIGVGLNAHTGDPFIGIIYELFPPRDKELPPGLRQHVVNFVFRPKGGFSDGESSRLEFVIRRVGDLVEKSSFTVKPVRRPALDRNPDILIPGEIRFGSSDPEMPLNVRWTLEPRGDGQGAGREPEATMDVILRWRNASTYDAIRIERNGTAHAELPGGATEYRDRDVPGGVFTYRIRGVVGEQPSFPARVFLSTLSPPGSFLRGDANGDGRIDVSDPIGTLDFLFRGGPPLRCEDGADSDDDGELTITDPIRTLGHLFLGNTILSAPGAEFPWFDPTPDTLVCRR